MKNFTCIVCPEGCAVAVSNDGEISGNRCPRGVAYVRSEMTAPKRSISTTVLLRGGGAPVLPVKTAAPVPKEKIFAVMDACKSAGVEAPVAPGQVIIKDVCGTGVDIVSCARAPARRGREGVA